MNLHFFIQSELFSEPSECITPLLAQQLGRAERQQHDRTLTQQYCKAHGVVSEVGAPHAAIRRHGEGLPDDGAMYFWVYPVHLQLQRDFFSLSSALSLAPDEMQAITSSLNHHFAQEGLQFMPSQGGQGWYLRFAQYAHLVATEIDGMLGQAVPSQLVQGGDAEHWHRLHNEMQMLLFSHPVNQARETQGLLPINSLWLAGGGRLPTIPTAENLQIFGEDALSQGIARLCGRSMQRLPSALHELLANQKTAGGNATLVLPTKMDIDQHWITPLISALRARKVKSAKVTLQQGRHAVTYTLTGMTTFKIWRSSI